MFQMAFEGVIWVVEIRAHSAEFAHIRPAQTGIRVPNMAQTRDRMEGPRPPQVFSVPKEGEVRFFLVDALEVERDFAEVVVSPHAGFAAGDLAVLGDVVPAVGAVIDGVQEDALMIRIDAQIGFVEEGVEHGEAGLPVALGVGELAALGEDISEAQKALGGDRRSGAVDRLEVIERLGGAVQVVAH